MEGWFRSNKYDLCSKVINSSYDNIAWGGTSAVGILAQQGSNPAFKTVGNLDILFYANNSLQLTIDDGTATFEGDVTINSDNLTLTTNASIPLLSLETSHASGIPIVNLKGASSSQVRYQDENGTIQSRIDLLDGVLLVL